jgi:hypothetical protein
MVQVAIAVRAVGVRKNKKRQRETPPVTVYISHIWGVDSTEPTVIFCASLDLTDVINCAKFHFDRLRVCEAGSKNRMFP